MYNYWYDAVTKERIEFTDDRYWCPRCQLTVYVQFKMYHVLCGECRWVLLNA